jgi:hypothetical protein
MTESQAIARGGDARLDVALVMPDAHAVRFLGPGDLQWMVLQPVEATVTGLIDLEVQGRDARQRIAFTLLVDPSHPVDFNAEPVASPTW